jgi:hypothetical protein
VEYVIVAVVTLAAAGAISAYAFWQGEINTYVAYQAWQSGPYRDLVDRLYHGASAGDSAAVAACVEQRAAPIVHDKKGETAIQYGGGMLTKTITFKELAARGPFKVRRLELEPEGAGGVLVHTADRSGTPLGFMVRHGTGGQLRITTLVTQHLGD